MYYPPYQHNQHQHQIQPQPQHQQPYQQQQHQANSSTQSTYQGPVFLQPGQGYTYQLPVYSSSVPYHPSSFPASVPPVLPSSASDPTAHGWQLIAQPPLPTPTPYETPLPSPLPTNTTDTLTMPHHPVKISSPPIISRSRRAAASKARHTISAATNSLRAPPLSERSINVPTPPRPSRPLSSSRKPKAIKMDLDPEPLPITLKNCRDTLLPCPAGSSLEVNDLLILHPPALSPNHKRDPVNQYNPPSIPETTAQAYQSQFEMYTCRVCSKTYDGKNARSVARRHLQDKHGVPLALQQRRTRWDGEPDRPKSAGAAREKTLKSKRDWAQRTRHIQRLEKTHEKFLETFGPEGMLAPCGTRLIAPSMRKAPASRVKQYPRGWLSWIEIPLDLRKSLQNQPNDANTDYNENYEEGYCLPEQVPEAKVAVTKGSKKGKGKKKAALSISTINTATSSHFSINSLNSPLRPQTASDHPSRTPISDTRTTQDSLPNGQMLEYGDTDAEGEDVDMEEEDRSWTGLGSATHISDTALQAALAQHYGYSYPTYENGAVNYQLGQDGYQDLPITGQGENTQSCPNSPAEPLYTLEERSAVIQEWAGPTTQPLWLAQAFSGHETFSSAATSVATEEQTWERDEMMETLEDIPERMEEERAEATIEAIDEKIESETRAAESLLNLHSTPARPCEYQNDGDISAAATRGTRQVSPAVALSSTLGNVSGLLDPPEITPRPRPHRARSLIQPFAKSRPEAPSRSLSFTDDPFAFSPLPPSTSRAKKRRSTIASPSPLQVKRQKEDGSPRMPLSLIKSSANLSNTLGLGSSFMTPVRGGRTAVPTSLSKVWLLSSPNTTDAAASLGLVPGWGMVGTPGVSGMVGVETPWRPSGGVKGISGSGEGRGTE